MLAYLLDHQKSVCVLEKFARGEVLNLPCTFIPSLSPPARLKPKRRLVRSRREIWNRRHFHHSSLFCSNTSVSNYRPCCPCVWSTAEDPEGFKTTTLLEQKEHRLYIKSIELKSQNTGPKDTHFTHIGDTVFLQFCQLKAGIGFKSEEVEVIQTHIFSFSFLFFQYVSSPYSSLTLFSFFTLFISCFTLPLSIFLMLDDSAAPCSTFNGGIFLGPVPVFLKCFFYNICAWQLLCGESTKVFSDLMVAQEKKSLPFAILLSFVFLFLSFHCLFTPVFFPSFFVLCVCLP